VVLALAADHVVRDPAAFVEACRKALSVANAGRIVTFGVLPERPATEYGYIRPGDAISGDVRKVAKFVEAGSRDGRRVCRRRLSLELRKLHVPRADAAR
jgi:mannose-1-phosphate guanylyltransferase